jgi:hypothetical protein
MRPRSYPAYCSLWLRFCFCKSLQTMQRGWILIGRDAAPLTAYADDVNTTFDTIQV